MVDWNHRSFREMQTSGPAEEQSGDFGSPLTEGQPRHPLSSQTDVGAVNPGRAHYGTVAPGALDATAPQNQADRVGNSYINNPAGNGAGYGWSPYGSGAANNGADRTGYANAPQPADSGRWTPAPEQMGVQHSTQPGVGDNPLPGNGTPAEANRGPAIIAPGQKVSEEQRQWIANSLHEGTNYSNYFTWSLLGGLAGSGPLPYALDRWGHIYNSRILSNFSPLSMQIDQENKTKSDHERVRQLLADQKDSAFDKEIAKNDERIKASEGRLASLNKGNSAFPLDGGKGILGYQSKEVVTGADVKERLATLRDEAQAERGTIPADDEERVNANKAKIDTFKKAFAGQSIDPIDIKVATIQPGELPNEYKYLTPQESAALQDHVKIALTLNQGGSLRDRLINKVPLVDKPLKYEDAKFERPPASSNAWLEPGGKKGLLTGFRGNNWSNTLGESLAVGATALATDHLVDKYMPNVLGLVGGNKDHDIVNHNYMLEFPITAGFMLSNMNPAKKIFGTAAALGLNGVLEAKGPAPSGEYSKLMRPNQYDAALMSAAWMLPSKTALGRVAAVGLGWGAGRAANFANNVMHVPVPGLGEADYARGLKNEFTEAVENDKPTSNKSFKNIVEKGHALGMENEGALELAMNDYNTDHAHDQKNTLGVWHNAAAQATALGDFNLERGTKIDEKAHNDERRILTGSNLDLGGQALKAYRTAAGELINAQNKAIKDKMPQDQIDDLKKSTKFVEDKINVIYGKHDIKGLFDQLKKDVVNPFDVMLKFRQQLDEEVQGLNTKDPRYLAKMSRDMAMVNMAFASYQAEHGNGGDASLMFSSAQDYLKVAAQLDPKAPDLAQLQDISKDVAKAVPDAQNRQYSNTFNNPYKIDTPTH